MHSLLQHVVMEGNMSLSIYIYVSIGLVQFGHWYSPHIMVQGNVSIHCCIHSTLKLAPSSRVVLSSEFTACNLFSVNDRPWHGVLGPQADYIMPLPQPYHQVWKKVADHKNARTLNLKGVERYRTYFTTASYVIRVLHSRCTINNYSMLTSQIGNFGKAICNPLGPTQFLRL